MRPLNTLTMTSLTRTGTGAEESIAHGQNAVPALVQIQMRDSSKTFTIGAHTVAVAKVTVQLNAIYDLIIWWNK